MTKCPGFHRACCRKVSGLSSESRRKQRSSPARSKRALYTRSFTGATGRLIGIFAGRSTPILKPHFTNRCQNIKATTMIKRPQGHAWIEEAFRQVPVVRLSGVRRTGKTVLTQSFGVNVFLNCNLPSSVDRLHDPESFFRSVGKGLVVLDGVHQFPDPSRILKIAADAFPDIRVLAGSSTLAATHKFRDFSRDGNEPWSWYPCSPRKWKTSA